MDLAAAPKANHSAVQPHGISDLCQSKDLVSPERRSFAWPLLAADRAGTRGHGA